MVLAGVISAQNITNSLATGGIFSILNGTNTFFTVKQSTGLVGIGTNATDPRAQLEIGGTEGLLVRGTVNSGIVRALGAGVRLHWYPRKGAFRVGNAETSYWDDDGTANPKMSLYSIAMGYQPRATAVASTAIGAYNQSTGDYSLSLGSYSRASASHAIAIGTQAYATGIYSIAIGSGANTNGKDGAMVVGDDAYFQTAYSAQDNSLTMRFIGGYRLWSSYPDSTSGVYMRHGQSGWSNYSDRNMKENFEPVDGEWVLGKIKNMPITKWNYKKTDPNEKYIGPISQDFHAAFHLNGTDSLGINSISIDGVNMAAIKALEKRTSLINDKMKEIIEQNEKLILENEQLREQLSSVSKINNQLLELRKLTSELKNQLQLVKGKKNENVALILK
jgi:regulator of replication initiation timing